MSEQPTRESEAGAAPTIDHIGVVEEAGAPVAPPGYELLEEIGRGGMGIVYRAREVALNRGVAIKVLRHHHPADSPAARRFFEEALITSQLQHPGIPPIHQIGTLSNGQPFLAMKLIKGRTLEELLNERVDPADDRGRFLAAFEQVCHPVACAHDRKVIHRDLKPSNVMVGNFGEVQVMDWGLAKPLTPSGVEPDTPPAPAAVETEIRTLRDSNGTFTQVGSVMGTPAFVSPEQAGGEGEKIDERTDVFGLGAILCVILTGQPPYTGKDADSVRLKAIRGQLDECLARLDACGAEPELLALAKRCLAADPADRPRNAGEVAAAVAGLRAAADERARQAELEKVRAEGELRAAEVRAAEQRKRRKVQAALGLTFIALLTLGVSFAWWRDRQAAERRADEERRAAADRERLTRNADAVVALLGQCELALREDDAPRAGVALEQAERRAADGGADHLADRLTRCRTELAMLREIDRIDDLRWSFRDDEVVSDRAGGKWPDTFAQFGIADQTPPEAAARRVHDSPLRDRLLGSLDRWHVTSQSAGVLAILRAVDPDPYRTAVREALRLKTRDHLRGLVLQPEALAQPDWFATFLGELDGLAQDRRKAVLLAVVRHRPTNFRALMELANQSPINQPAGAGEREVWYRTALAVRPANPVAWTGLGQALSDQGRMDEAIECFQTVLRIDPALARAHLGLGLALYRKGDFGAAAAALREASRRNPGIPEPYSALGHILRLEWNLREAADSFRRATEVAPGYARAHRELALTLGLMGDQAGALAASREATRLFEEAIGKAPQSAASYSMLAWLLAVGPDGARDADRAVSLATKACELTDWRHPNFLDTLAAAYAAAGDFDKAVEYQKLALALIVGKPEIEAFRDRLALYGRKTPYRETLRRPTAPAPREVNR